MLGLAPLSAELLKPLLAYPHVPLSWRQITAASWPSGHATAATSLALCAVLVVPPRLRPAVAVLGVLFSLVVGVTLLMLAWHMPSDVLGGYLLAGFWVSLAIALLGYFERRWPSRPARARAHSGAARAGRSASSGALSARRA